MISIRQKFFETNSSSAHALILGTSKPRISKSVELTEEKNDVWISGVYHDRSYNSSNNTLMYYTTAQGISDELIALLYKWGVKEVYTNGHVYYFYDEDEDEYDKDLDSRDKFNPEFFDLPKMNLIELETEEELKRFLFSDDSYVINDDYDNINKQYKPNENTKLIAFC